MNIMHPISGPTFLLVLLVLALLPAQVSATSLKISYYESDGQLTLIFRPEANLLCSAVYLREAKNDDNEATVSADIESDTKWNVSGNAIFNKQCIKEKNSIKINDSESKLVRDWIKKSQKLAIVLKSNESTSGFVDTPTWEEKKSIGDTPPSPLAKCTESVSPGEPIPDECDLTKELTPYFSSCQNPPGFNDHLVVCLDAYNDDTPVISGLPQRANHVLPPNRPLLVMVRHREDRSVSINISGTRGLYRPATLNLTGIGTQQAARGKIDPEPMASSARRALISRRAFAPRTPDPIDLTVKVYQSADGAQKLVGQEVVEFIVEQTYGAAVRLGLAVVGGSAVDREYEVRSLATGQQSVAARSFGTVNAELVLGFAPFIDFFRGGRGYSNWNNLTRFPFGISPYVGIGVVNASQNSLEVFKSVYLGGEWEISGNFSIAVTWVGRRVTRLADGVSEGMPVPEGTVTTVTGFDYGWGVILNLSPDFFRIAQKSGSSFFGR